MSNEAEDPIVVCIKVYHTQTKELDTKSFAPRPLSRTAAWATRRVIPSPDCKVSAIVDGKPAKVDGWKGSAGTRFVRVADAPGCIVAMLMRKRKFLERQLASYDAVIANPLAVIPLHHSEVK